MRKLLFICLAFVGLHLLAAPPTGTQQQQKRLALYGVAFYNLENLFDTIPNNPRGRDVEFTPDGQRQWNGAKYWSKRDKKK